MKKIQRVLKLALGAVACATLSGCPAVASEPLDYLCHVSMENVRVNIDNILQENDSQRLLIMYYTTYKNNLINIQYECPEDSIEPNILLETEKIMKSLVEYKLNKSK